MCQGLFSGPCSTSLDHDVLIVGYVISSVPWNYWIVKNSWGAGWGMEGYVCIERKAENPEGLCGINRRASYPIKTGPNPPLPPGPIQCDFFTECSPRETCCCVLGLPVPKICFWWGCCPLESAVCCGDLKHCCPSDFPVCDIERNLCFKVSLSKIVALD